MLGARHDGAVVGCKPRSLAGRERLHLRQPPQMALDCPKRAAPGSLTSASGAGGPQKQANNLAMLAVRCAGVRLAVALSGWSGSPPAA